MQIKSTISARRLFVDRFVDGGSINIKLDYTRGKKRENRVFLGHSLPVRPAGVSSEQIKYGESKNYTKSSQISCATRDTRHGHTKQTNSCLLV